MKAVKILALLIVVALLFSTTGSVLAASPEDNPGKGPPAFEKTVFVHYGQDVAPGKPSATPGNGPPSNKDKDDELYSYSRVHWADGDIPVSYWINMTGNPIDSIDTEEGINASFQVWEDDPESYIDFQYEGITTEYLPGIDVDRPDEVNVVGWADLSDPYYETIGIPSNAIGVTIVWSIRGKKLIVDCDTVLNSASHFAWTQYKDGGDPNETWLPGYDDTTVFDVDVQNIMTHEAGHWLKLNDLYYDAAIEQTMFGYALDGELKSRSLEAGDTDGVRKIYAGATQ